MSQAQDYLELLTPDNAAMLFIDNQTTLTLGVQSIDLTLLKTNIEGLEKVAQMFGLPVVLTVGGSVIARGRGLSPQSERTYGN